MVSWLQHPVYKIRVFDSTARVPFELDRMFYASQTLNDAMLNVHKTSTLSIPTKISKEADNLGMFTDSTERFVIVL